MKDKYWHLQFGKKGKINEDSIGMLLRTFKGETRLEEIYGGIDLLKPTNKPSKGTKSYVIEFTHHIDGSLRKNKLEVKVLINQDGDLNVFESSEDYNFKKVDFGYAGELWKKSQEIEAAIQQLL
ncbi:MAG: hypothetical protein KKG60_04090 [Nanoarchaeota archaeon]|nr:hypothetical protein [Nanoarchaeota archaeon]